MNDRVLYAVALTCSIVGLVLLFFAREESATRFVVEGKIIGKEGRTALVQTTIPVQVRNATIGKNISEEVFWEGTKFVAVPKT